MSEIYVDWNKLDSSQMLLVKVAGLETVICGNLLKDVRKIASAPISRETKSHGIRDVLESYKQFLFVEKAISGEQTFAEWHQNLGWRKHFIAYAPHLAFLDSVVEDLYCRE